MKEELLKDSTIKSIDQSNIIIKCPFYNESELVSHYIIEKLISYVISELFKKEVERKISEYCYNDLLDILNDIKEVEFMEHDKDDLIKKHSLLDQISKTPKHNKNKLQSDLIPNLSEKYFLNKSEIIRGYNLMKELDPNISYNGSIDIKPLLSTEDYNLYNKKKVMNILNRKNFKEIKEKDNNKFKNNIKTKNIEEHFKNKNSEQIEKIERIESIKIENIPIDDNKNNNIIITSEHECLNNWNIIPQPNHSIIDRYASTKLKIENYIFKDYLLENNIIENDNKDKIENKINNISNIRNNRKLATKFEKTKKYQNNNFNNIKEKESSVKKKKKIIQMVEFPSYSLESEKTKRSEESEEIKEMRKMIEMFNQRNMEEIKEKKASKKIKEENSLKKEKKGFIGGNITVDIKGKIVYVKPIQIESLIKEFKSMGSRSKEVGRIEDETYVKKSFKNIKVEVNNEDYFEQLEKLEKKRQNTSKTNNSKKDTNKDKNKDTKNESKTEKNKSSEINGVKFASGSNFEIINLECGVNLTENKKKKTGGKDYFRKYGRCSFEIFQDQLHKTSSGFYNIDNNLINIDINDENSKNKNDINLPVIIKKNEDEIKIMEHNLTNNIMKVKTKNLKLALNNLDLINEKNLREENNIEDKKIDILKNNNIKEKKVIKDLGEMNIFNKTLMKNKLWGDPNQTFQKYMIRNYPIRPNQKYLIKEKSQNQLKMSPRRRLPPIQISMKSFEEYVNRTETGNFSVNKKSKKKLKDLKIKNLSKDSLYENKSKYLLSSTSGFYNNTDNIHSSNKKDDEM